MTQRHRSVNNTILPLMTLKMDLTKIWISYWSDINQWHLERLPGISMKWKKLTKQVLHPLIPEDKNNIVLNGI